MQLLGFRCRLDPSSLVSNTAIGWRSSMAEQRFCKPQVGGSIPLASSNSPIVEVIHGTSNLGDSKGMCPLRGESTRGLAPA
jgi:hypothetical protein